MPTKALFSFFLFFVVLTTCGYCQEFLTQREVFFKKKILKIGNFQTIWLWNTFIKIIKIINFYPLGVIKSMNLTLIFHIANDVETIHTWKKKKCSKRKRKKRLWWQSNVNGAFVWRQLTHAQFDDHTLPFYVPHLLSPLSHLELLNLYFFISFETQQRQLLSRGYFFNEFIDFSILLLFLECTQGYMSWHIIIECCLLPTEEHQRRIIILVVGCSRVKITNRIRRRKIAAWNVIHIFSLRISDWYLMPHYTLISCTCDS
jgi:hypothetical protein